MYLDDILLGLVTFNLDPPPHYLKLVPLPELKYLGLTLKIMFLLQTSHMKVNLCMPTVMKSLLRILAGCTMKLKDWFPSDCLGCPYAVFAKLCNVHRNGCNVQVHWE